MMVATATRRRIVHGPYKLHDIDNLDLEEGGTI